MWWICIASKVLNDSPVRNRIFAYLVNVDVNDFNKLEMEVMMKLNFNVLVDQEEFESYEKQLDQYSQLWTGLIDSILQEYKHDKKYLRRVRKQMREQLSQSTEAACISTSCHNIANYVGSQNFKDWQMSHVFDSQGWKVKEPDYPWPVSKFRFESYNSNEFPVYSNRKKQRWSKSQDLPKI